MTPLAEKIVQWSRVKINPRGRSFYFDPRTYTIVTTKVGDLEAIAQLAYGWPADPDYLFYHELGHAFLNALQRGDEERAAKVFGDFDEDDYDPALRLVGFRKKPRGFVTHYAAEHPHEDFAETFAHLMRCNGRIPSWAKGKTLRAKFRILQKLVRERV